MVNKLSQNQSDYRQKTAYYALFFLQQQTSASRLLGVLLLNPGKDPYNKLFHPHNLYVYILFISVEWQS